MGRRKNYTNYEQNKRIAKMLLLHRVWNGMTQTDLAKELGVSFQQLQKYEKCVNRITAESLFKLCQTKKWDIKLWMDESPEMTLETWHNRENKQKKQIYHRIQALFENLNQNGERNYYKKDPIPFVIDSIEKGN